MSRFEEWHESQTHEAYNSLDCPHYSWEKLAWDAAIDEAVKAVSDKKEVQPFGEYEFLINSTYEDMAKAIKELKQ